MLDDLSTGTRRNLEGLDVEVVEGSITDMGYDSVATLLAAYGLTGSRVRPSWRPGQPVSLRVGLEATVAWFQEARPEPASS
ncbi:MAG: hypothetical protein H0W25_15015 [Acidimicrobiia bacterium]|nr:hypothetical protein [Acidimicrobiia bacterium]